MKQIGLVLEDSPERAALMHQRFPEELRNQIFWCRTAVDAIGVLRDYKEQIFFVSLEHDLEGLQQQNSASDTSGMEVVRYLEKQEPKSFGQCTFVIHSHNPKAGPKMVKRLKKVGYEVYYQPFGV